jgi:hypothetical protein
VIQERKDFLPFEPEAPLQFVGSVFLVDLPFYRGLHTPSNDLISLLKPFKVIFIKFTRIFYGDRPPEAVGNGLHCGEGLSTEVDETETPTKELSQEIVHISIIYRFLTFL